MTQVDFRSPGKSLLLISDSLTVHFAIGYVHADCNGLYTLGVLWGCLLICVPFTTAKATCEICGKCGEVAHVSQRVHPGCAER